MSADLRFAGRGVLDSRVASMQGNNMLSISISFREALSIVRNAWSQNVHDFANCTAMNGSGASDLWTKLPHWVES